MPEVMAARCLNCRHEFTASQTENSYCCPHCENPLLPVDPADDVQVTINWHELRVLVMWAERWASEKCDPPYSVSVVRAIATAIENQYPGKAAVAPLTFYGEILQIKSAMGEGAQVYQNVVIEPDDLSIPLD